MSMDVDEVFTDEGEDWNCEDVHHDVPGSPEHHKIIETTRGGTNWSHNAFSRKSTSIAPQRGSIKRNRSDKVETAAQNNINKEVLESGLLKPLQPSNSLVKGARTTLYNSFSFSGRVFTASKSFSNRTGSTEAPENLHAEGTAVLTDAPAVPPSLSSQKEEALTTIKIERQPARKALQNDGNGTRSPQSNPNSGWGTNFVRINLKKGKGTTRHPNRAQKSRRSSSFRSYKSKGRSLAGHGANFMEGCVNNASTCFRCGGQGHWASKCTFEMDKPESGESVDELRPASLAESSSGSSRSLKADETQAAGTTIADPLVSVVDEDLVEACRNLDTDSFTALLQQVFGHPEFRPGQLDIITQALQGISCLAMLPTGSGKSLCYQLPSLVLPGLTLVISPLIALMKDQARQMHPSLRPAVLWSGQSARDTMQILDDVRAGKHKVLLVSPERVSSPHLLSALEPLLPLSLVVVDECHCVTEWGHSFRPSYYRLGRRLQQELPSHAILALTATATRRAEREICLSLGIQKTIRQGSVKPNLRLHVRQNTSGLLESKLDYIVSLLSSAGPLHSTKSILIFCAFRHDADILAARLHARGHLARSYHAGKHSQERQKLEMSFVEGKIRIIVATVAFGMGINLPGIGAIIHASMPRSVEEYVQQIGRAGRNGDEAHCFAIIDDTEFCTLRARCFGGRAELESMNLLLNRILGRWQENVEKDDASACFGVLDLKKTCLATGLGEETIESVLSHLEVLRPDSFRMLASAATKVKASFFSRSAADVGQECSVVTAMLKLCKPSKTGAYNCPLDRLSSVVGKSPGLIIMDLRRLATDNIIGFELSAEQGPAYQLLQAPTSMDMASLANEMVQWLDTRVRHQTDQLDSVYRAFGRALHHKAQLEQERRLRCFIETYFSSEGPDCLEANAAWLKEEPLPLKSIDDQAISVAKRAFALLRHEPRFSRHSVCEILLGIPGVWHQNNACRTKLQGLFGCLAHVCGWELERALRDVSM